MCFFMFGAILKTTNSSFQKGMTNCGRIYVKKVMKLLAFIFEQSSYIFCFYIRNLTRICFLIPTNQVKCHNHSSQTNPNWESPAQFENQIKPCVYVRCITPSNMYEKAPFC